MAEPRYDRKEQFQQVQSGLLPGEEIIAVYDAIGAGTGFIGLTTKRVIVQDRSFVGNKVAITSIPYSKITSVSVVSNKSWAGNFFSTGSIAINVAATGAMLPVGLPGVLHPDVVATQLVGRVPLPVGDHRDPGRVQLRDVGPTP